MTRVSAKNAKNNGIGEDSFALKCEDSKPMFSMSVHSLLIKFMGHWFIQVLGHFQVQFGVLTRNSQ